MKRTVSWWKIGAVSLFALSGVVLGSWLWVESIETRKWEQMDLRIAEWRAGWGRCPARTRIPRGEPLRGIPWKIYIDALIDGPTDDGDGVRDFVISDNRTRMESARLYVSHRTTELRLLAELARRGDHESPGRLPPTGAYRELSFLCVARSRLLAADGNWRKAIDPLLDFTRVMLDYMDEHPDRSDYACGELALPLLELKKLAASAPMSPDELTSLEKELASLDAGFPCYLVALQHIMIRTGNALQDPQGPYHFPASSKQNVFAGARFAWSTRLMKADAFLTVDAAARKVHRLHDGPYGPLLRAYEDIAISRKSSRNPLAPHLGMVNRWMDVGLRVRHGQIRLARAAARYRACREILELADPFGITLRHEVIGDQVTFSSVETDTSLDLRPEGRRAAKDPDFLRATVPR